MKIAVIGDPHGKIVSRSKLKGVDFILITGDLGKADLARKRFFENIKRKAEGLEELEFDNDFKKKINKEIHDSTLFILKYYSEIAPVYTLEGNVGIFDASDVREGKEKGLKVPYTLKQVSKMKNVSLVKNGVRKINGLRIGFLKHFHDASWVKEFKPSDYSDKMKAARKESKQAKNVLKNFKDVDILVCHSPPFGVLDKVSGNFGAPKKWWGKRAGSKVILDYIKKKQLKYVFCGHIHEGVGKKKVGKTEVYNVGFAGDYKIIEIK
jgi:Icc-related predicted phosphoesterase